MKKQISNIRQFHILPSIFYIYGGLVPFRHSNLDSIFLIRIHTIGLRDESFNAEGLFTLLGRGKTGLREVGLRDIGPCRSAKAALCVIGIV